MPFPPQEKRKTLGQDPNARIAVIKGIEELFEGAPLRHEDYEKPARDRAGSVRADRMLQISTRVLQDFPSLFIRISKDATVEPCSIKGEDGAEKKYVRVAWSRGKKEEWGHMCFHTTEEIKPGDTVLCHGFLLCRRVRPVDAKSKQEVGKAAYYLSVDGDDIRVNVRETDLPSGTMKCWLIKGKARPFDRPLLGERGHWQMVMTHFWFGGLSDHPEEVGTYEEEDAGRPQFHPRSRERSSGRPQLTGPQAPIQEPRVEVVRPTVRPQAPVVRTQPAPSPTPTPTLNPEAKKKAKPAGSGKMKRVEAGNGNPFEALGAAMGLSPATTSTQQQVAGE
jgi:hypothetical protein